MKTLLLLLTATAVLLSVVSTARADAVLLERVESALKTGDLTSAETLLAPAVAGEKPDAAALNLFSRLRLAQKNSKEAIALADRATAADPTQAAYFVQLGRACSVRIGEVSFLQQAMLSGKLRKAFEQGLKLDPNNLDALIGLTRYHLQAPEIAGGSIVKAREYAERTRQLNPFLGEIELGQIAEREKQIEVALGHYETAATLNSSHAGIQNACGRLLAQLGRKDAARSRFEAALALNPNHEGAQKGLAGLAEGGGS